MKKTQLLSAGLLALAAAGFYAISAESTDQSAKPSTPVIEVAVLSLTPTTLARAESLPGRVTPVRQAQVRPQVDGIITSRLFAEGAEVKQGQQLYQIDETRYKALAQSARAALESARTNANNTQTRLDRFKELLKSKAISQQAYDDLLADFNKAKAAVSVAQANLELAKVDLSYTKVYAPINGRISRSYVSEGALVAANQNQELALITQLDPVYVDMQQSSANDLGVNALLTKGAKIPVELTFDRQTEAQTYSHTGELQFSEVTMNETTASRVLRALFPNPEGELLPGMFVRAKLNLGAAKNLLVPQRATTRTAQGMLKVWIVDAENKAQPREIKVDGTSDDNWLVTEGLSAGEQLIVEGYQKVRQGQVVSPSTWINANAATQTATSPAAKGE